MTLEDILKYLAIWIFCSPFAERAMAQPGVTFKALEEANLSVDSLRAALSLTADQAYILMLINERYATRFDSIRMSHDDRYKKYAKTEYLKDERDNELKVLLSDRQFRVYHSWQGSKKVADRQRERVYYSDQTNEEEGP